jgi:elongation factor G
MDLRKVRNFGISAHIDSGKTTLSERILYYTGRIHKIEEVKGGGDGATMDSMDLEKERGITIQSAATAVKWKLNGDEHFMNLIDTPGHVDFTIEVERSLRVLDGAVLVLCAVGGVQPQSITVDRQMKRYKVARLAFVNKMDRIGADAYKCVRELREKLGIDCALIQMPIGAGETYEGHIDLITMKAFRFTGDKGETVEEYEIPAAHLDKAKKLRHEMLEALAMYSDELMSLLMEEQEVPQDLIHKVLKQAAQTQGFTPVLVGTAFKNKGVQSLLDAIVRYLPSPLEREYFAKSWKNPDEKFPLYADDNKPFVGMAFKIVDEAFGQVTYTRIYQGKIEKGGMYVNQRTGKTDRFSSIYKMHAEKKEPIDGAGAGDIVGIVGIDCASGDTYAAESKFCVLESMFVPDAVIKMSITPVVRADSDKLSKALQRFRREDPTFRVFNDEESGEILIAGMGELHLEIYCERIRREYKVDVQVGAPKVSYRESPTRKYEYNYKHKKQTGGSGQFAHIVGSLGPIVDEEEMKEDFIFEENIVGGRIPKEYIPSVEKGFRAVILKGPLAQYPVVGLKVTLDDGSYHDVDSSDRAFQTAAEGCFREHFADTKPAILEPIMKIEIECPERFQGAVTGDLTSRRGMVTGSDIEGNTAKLQAEVPLAETFGYSTDIRSMTQGQGTFTMELGRYAKVPASIQEEIIAEKKKQLAAAGK